MRRPFRWDIVVVFRAASAAAPLCRKVSSLSSAYLALAFGIDLIRRLPRAQLLDHTLVRLRTAVVKGAEPAVGGKQRVAVIALEVAVVQIVEEIAGNWTPTFTLILSKPICPTPDISATTCRLNMAWIGCEGTTQYSSTTEKKMTCSIGCIAKPVHGPVLTFLWWI